MEVSTRQIASATIEARIIRADGTVEELGVIDTYTRPWWRTLISKFSRH